MRGVVLKSFGKITSANTFELRDDVPEPRRDGPKQVIIKIHAASLNPVDWKVAEGKLRPVARFNLPCGVGYDVSGTVEFVGPQVTKFKAGDAVIAQLYPPTNPGALQEYISVDETYVGRKPKNLSFEEAAGVPLAAMTALDCIETIGVTDTKPKTAFVPAGLGGVGLFATQMLQNVFGVQVATTVSTPKVEKTKQLLPGATVIDYRKTNYTTQLSNIDAVIDTTGDVGNEAKVLSHSGHVVSIATNPDPDTMDRVFGRQWFFVRGFLRLSHWLQQRKVSGVNGTYSFLWVKPSGSKLDRISDWIEQGKIKVVVDTVFPLEDYERAFALSKKGPTGKVIVKIV